MNIWMVMGNGGSHTNLRRVTKCSLNAHSFSKRAAEMHHLLGFSLAILSPPLWAAGTLGGLRKQSQITSEER